MSWILLGASGNVGRLIMAGAGHAGVQHNIAVPYTQRTRPPKVKNHAKKAYERVVSEVELCVDQMRANSQQAEALVVFAGKTHRDHNRALSDNISIARASVDMAAKFGIRKLIIASSSAVYGVGEGKPFTESSSPAPLNAYGRSKLEAENLILGNKPDNISITFLRIGNVAGADSLLMNAMINPDNIQIDTFEDGMTPRRSYIGPITMAKAIDTLARSNQHDLPPIINFACPSPIRMANLIEASGLRWTPNYQPDNKAQNITLDCTLLSELIGRSNIESNAERIIAELRATGMRKL